MTLNLFACIRVYTLDRLNVEWAGQVTDHTVKCHLYTLIFICRTAHHRYNAQVYTSLTHCFMNFVLRYAVRINKELLEQGIIVFSYCFYEMRTPEVNVFL